jgi:hypothetical protein
MEVAWEKSQQPSVSHTTALFPQPSPSRGAGHLQPLWSRVSVDPPGWVMPFPYKP